MSALAQSREEQLCAQSAGQIAIEACSKAINLGHRKAVIYYNRGYHWMVKGEYSKAIEDYSSSIKINPKDPDAFTSRGLAWFSKGEIDRAVEDYSRAIELHPRYTAAYYNRGSAWFSKGEIDKAISDFSEAIATDPKFTQGYINRGTAYSQKNEFGKAITDFTRAVELQPQNALAYQNRAFAHRQNGDLESSIKDYNKAIDLSPDDGDNYIGRGLSWEAKGDFVRAIVDFDLAITLNPKNAYAHSGRGSAWFQQGDFDRAISDYSEAIRLNPSDAVAYRNRGLAWEGKKNISNALADAKKATQLNPSDLNAKNDIHRYLSAMQATQDFSRGLTLAAEGAFGAAIQAFSSAIARDVGNAVFYVNRAAAYTHVEDFDAAIADATTAIKLDPDNARAFVVRGYARLDKRSAEQNELALADMVAAAQVDRSKAEQLIERLKQTIGGRRVDQALRVATGDGSVPGQEMAAQLPAPASGASSETSIQSPAVPALPQEANDALRKRCDELAASPFDPSRPDGIAGVLPDEMDAARAVSACERALAQSVDDVRMKFQLARALVEGERDLARAASLYKEAAERGFLLAMNNLAVLYNEGKGVEKNPTAGLAWLERAAAGGLGIAMRNIAEKHASGSGVPVSQEEASRWYLKAAEAGDTTAMFQIGRRYHLGIGVAVDFIIARGWYDKAAAAGNPSAMSNIGLLYENGNGVTQDYATARHWYEKAAAGGQTTAMNNLADIYLRGQGVQKNSALAAVWYRRAAEGGNSEAMNSLARLLFAGDGVAKNLSEARQWFEKAAASGVRDAMLALGAIHQDGLGVPQSYAEAMRWYTRAADAGSGRAMWSVAMLHDAGRGVPQNTAEAGRWMRKAAEAGLSEAMLVMGLMYERGEGAQQDFALARSWYAKAAAAGSLKAMADLGRLHASGLGGPRDYTTARRWYGQAADGGHAPSMFTLGGYYERGEGTEKDLEQARRWYERAANAGHAEAREALPRVGAGLSTLPPAGVQAASKYKDIKQWAAEIIRQRDAEYRKGGLDGELGSVGCDKFRLGGALSSTFHAKHPVAFYELASNAVKEWKNLSASRETEILSQRLCLAHFVKIGAREMSYALARTLFYTTSMDKFGPYLLARNVIDVPPTSDRSTLIAEMQGRMWVDNSLPEDERDFVVAAISALSMPLSASNQEPAANAAMAGGAVGPPPVLAKTAPDKQDAKDIVREHFLRTEERHRRFLLDVLRKPAEYMAALMKLKGNDAAKVCDLERHAARGRVSARSAADGVIKEYYGKAAAGAQNAKALADQRYVIGSTCLWSSLGSARDFSAAVWLDIVNDSVPEEGEVKRNTLYYAALIHAVGRGVIADKAAAQGFLERFRKSGTLSSDENKVVSDTLYLLNSLEFPADAPQSGSARAQAAAPAGGGSRGDCLKVAVLAYCDAFFGFLGEAQPDDDAELRKVRAAIRKLKAETVAELKGRTSDPRLFVDAMRDLGAGKDISLLVSQCAQRAPAIEAKVKKYCSP